MGRGQVIIVDAVLDHKLPIGGDVVFLGSGNDLHLARRRLVDDEVDIFLRAAQIAFETTAPWSKLAKQKSR